MTILVANVDQTTDTFGGLIAKTNQLASAMSISAVTTNSNTAVGNAAVSNVFSANILFATASINIGTLLRANTTSYLVTTNSTVNAIINSSSLSISSGAGNTVVNTSSFSLRTSTGNVVVNASSIGLYPNSTVNAIVNSSTLAISSSTGNAVVNTSIISISNTSATIYSANTTRLYHAVAVGVGANIVANTTTIFIGNSTVNTSISANTITLNGANVVLETATQTLSNKTFGNLTTFTADIIMSGNGQIRVPSSNTANRSGSPTSGMFRFNTDINRFEGYNGTSWGAVGGGATGSGGNEIFIENGQTVTADYTITAGRNAGTFGPVTINSGVTVTVPSGSTWSII
jgi:hypothetical protein